ncbi:MAG: 50S ribosomal protein L11 methyltransferase [Pseudomonadota bacterium]
MNEFYHVVTAKFSEGDTDAYQRLVHQAMVGYHCAGVEEFSLDQEWIDHFLGQRVLVEWEIPPEVYEQVENAVKDKNSYACKFYFSNENSREEAKDFVLFLQESYPKIEAKIIQEDVKDWNELWKKEYRPIIISNKLTIVPAWMREQKNEYQGPLFINPGTGFGTGNHETTYLCLKIVNDLITEKKIIPQNSSCLDFGCGSGILGLAAHHLGIPSVDFCDIDPMALENCQENLDLNVTNDHQYDSRLILRDRLSNVGKYDLVFANILLSALKTESKLLVNSLKNGGFLVLSGIFVDQIPDLCQIFAAYPHLQSIDQFQKGEWAAMLWAIR